MQIAAADEAKRPGQSAAASRSMARFRQIALQSAVVLLVLAMIVGMALLIRSSLAKQGIGFSFEYLVRPAGFNLSEGVVPTLDGWKPGLESVTSGSLNVQVLVAGLLNSLKVAVLAIVFSTAAGVGIGVGRLSTNWLVRKLSFYIVEFVRNTPLLIQLVFWYFAIVLRFPPVTSSANVSSVAVLSQSGIFLPAIDWSDGSNPASVIALFAFGAALLASAFPRLGRRVRLLALAVAIVGLLVSVAGSFPLEMEFPVVGRFGANGGISLSPEMAAILIAVTVNSAAYTAEIVRGAIEAIPKGQWEASAALGLSRHDALKDIVLPQVFRVVLPSLGNRYISLTKDTSLGIAIGYPDLFNVYGTVSNQTGRNLEGVIIVMVTYLLLSWVISGAINVVNSRIAGREKADDRYGNALGAPEPVL